MPQFPQGMPGLNIFINLPGGKEQTEEDKESALVEALRKKKEHAMKAKSLELMEKISKNTKLGMADTSHAGGG